MIFRRLNLCDYFNGMLGFKKKKRKILPSFKLHRIIVLFTGMTEMSSLIDVLH